MEFFQEMSLAAKSGATITLGHVPGGSAPAASGDGKCHPEYLLNDAMVITTHAAAFDTTFWGCGATFRIRITRAG